jgi:hypothetical protein
MSIKGFDFSSWQDAPDTPVFIDFTKAVAIGAQPAFGEDKVIRCDT